MSGESEPMTSGVDLDGLRRLLEKATPLPWVVTQPPVEGGIPTPPLNREAGVRIVHRGERDGWVVNALNLPKDAELIVAAVSALPQLVEEIGALRNGVRKALDELGIPDEHYPAPVANAVEILRSLLGGLTEGA